MVAPIRIESNGSFWLIYEDRGVYMRMPKQEGPRTDAPDHRRDPLHPLCDMVWHPMVDWWLEHDGNALRIRYEEGRSALFAPRDAIGGTQ